MYSRYLQVERSLKRPVTLTTIYVILARMGWWQIPFLIAPLANRSSAEGLNLPKSLFEKVFSSTPNLANQHYSYVVTQKATLNQYTFMYYLMATLYYLTAYPQLV